MCFICSYILIKFSRYRDLQESNNWKREGLIDINPFICKGFNNLFLFEVRHLFSPMNIVIVTTYSNKYLAMYESNSLIPIKSSYPSHIHFISTEFIDLKPNIIHRPIYSAILSNIALT